MAFAIDNENLRPLPGAIVKTFELSAAATMGDAVYMVTGKKCAPARGNAAGTSHARGFIVSRADRLPSTALAAGVHVGVILHGPMAGLTGMDLTKPVWLSTATAGLVTQTMPTGGSNFVQEMGYPTSDDEFFVAPLASNIAGV